MKLLAMAMCLVLWGTSAAAQGISADLTPQQIQAAIADTKGDGCYGLHSRKALQPRVLVACFTTPYSRVAGAAQSAKKKYQPFTEADVTPELIASGELHIHAFAGKPMSGPGMANVQAIVILPQGEKDKAKAVQPTKTSEVTAEYKNMMGAAFEGRSITAIFPLELLTESNEVHVVYDTKIHQAWCDDCKAEIKLGKDVR